MKKKAFTLAEVLITLGIIGVVAALVMPGLIVNYQKKETVVRLQKAYSEMSQAVKLSELTNGQTADWDYTTGPEEFFNKYLKDYLKNIKVLGDVTNDYKLLNLSSAKNVTATLSYVIALANGTYITIRGSDASYTCIIIGVDVNGAKGPNIFGKDFFLFGIQPDYGFTPYGFGIANQSGQSFGYEYDRNTLLNAPSSMACNKSQYGYWCAALIMADGWEIAPDYPW